MSKKWAKDFKAFYNWCISEGWQKRDKIKCDGLIYGPETCYIQKRPASPFLAYCRRTGYSPRYVVQDRRAFPQEWYVTWKAWKKTRDIAVHEYNDKDEIYTGYHDKKKRKIYHGDKVKEVFKEINITDIYEVVFHEGKFMLKGRGSYYVFRGRRLEVFN